MFKAAAYGLFLYMQIFTAAWGKEEFKSEFYIIYEENPI